MVVNSYGLETILMYSYHNQRLIKKNANIYVILYFWYTIQPYSIMYIPETTFLLQRLTLQYYFQLKKQNLWQTLIIEILPKTDKSSSLFTYK